MGKANKTTRQDRNKGQRLVVIQTDAMFAANKTQNRRMLELYTTPHQILTIGDGDFSFSLALAVELALRRKDGSSQLIATSYDSLPQVLDKYPSASNSIASLSSLGLCVLHGVDGTNIASSIETSIEKTSRRPGFVTVPPVIRNCGRVVFNFPHVGGSTEDDTNANREVLRGFFRSCRELLTLPTPPSSDKHDDHLGGQVHVALRTTSFYRAWGLEELAAENGLKLLKTLPFVASSYPGYTEQRTNPGVMRAAPQADGAEINVFVFDMKHPMNQGLKNHVQSATMSKTLTYSTTIVDGSKLYVPEVAKGGVVLGKSKTTVGAKVIVKKTIVSVKPKSETTQTTSVENTISPATTPGVEVREKIPRKQTSRDDDSFDFNDFTYEAVVPRKRALETRSAPIEDSLEAVSQDEPNLELDGSSERIEEKANDSLQEAIVPVKRSNKRRKPQRAPEITQVPVPTPPIDVFAVKPFGEVESKAGISKSAVAPAYLRNKHPSQRPTLDGSANVNILEALGRGEERDIEYGIEREKRIAKETQNQQEKWSKSHPIRHDLFQVESFNNNESIIVGSSETSFSLKMGQELTERKKPMGKKDILTTKRFQYLDKKAAEEKRKPVVRGRGGFGSGARGGDRGGFGSGARGGGRGGSGSGSGARGGGRGGSGSGARGGGGGRGGTGSGARGGGGGRGGTGSGARGGRN